MWHDSFLADIPKLWQKQPTKTIRQNEKLLALQAAMAKIEKEFGRGSIMRMGDQSIENVEVISTGSLSLDAALGVGGYPRGRIIEIYGPESSVKPPSLFTPLLKAQKNGGSGSLY